MECSICCETYNKSTKSPVICNYCDFGACRECIKTFLLNKVHVPACMQCSREWPREFMDDNFTKQFNNCDLKKHREKILFEKEQCHLPHAQNFIRLENEKREVTLKMRELYEQLNTYRHEIVTLDDQMNRGDFARRKFVRKCPYEGCRGFLSTQWKCDVCENWTCPTCNEVKGPEKECGHQCNPQNVETAKLLKKDTRPCPNCGILIFKISGCAQMWCTECNTAFDWASLKIIRTQIHNPHFFEARRTAGVNLRDLADIPCGGLPSKREVALRIDPDKTEDIINKRWHPDETATVVMPGLLYAVDCVCHLNGQEAPVEPNNLTLRVQYLKKQISNEKLNFDLQVRDKKFQKNKEEFAVVDMVRTTMTDFLRQFVIGEMSYNDCINDTNKIIEYANSSMDKIARRYKNNVQFFSMNTYRQNHGSDRDHDPRLRFRWPPTDGYVFCWRDEYSVHAKSLEYLELGGVHSKLVFPKYFILR